MTSTDKKRLEAAWEFMKVVTNAESNSPIVIKTGYKPVRNPSMTYPDTVQYFQDNTIRKVALDQLEFTRPQAIVLL